MLWGGDLLVWNGVPLGWPGPYFPGILANFNALHMCLIPKGPHRGKVLVWGNHPFVAKTPTFVANQPANEYYSFQVFGIVDPAPTPAGFRFQNFLLPIEPITTSQMGPLATSVPNFFCAGQTWSPYGDLVVVGGTTFVVPPLSFSAANLTYLIRT